MSQQTPPTNSTETAPPANQDTAGATPTGEPTAEVSPSPQPTPELLSTSPAPPPDQPPPESPPTDLAQQLLELQAQLTTTQQERDAANQQLQDLATTQAAANQVALDQARRALLAENAGEIVAELVQGANLDELEASVGVAKAAFQRTADQLRAQVAAQVPTGASPVASPPIESLSPFEKITQALSRGGNNR